MTYNVYVTLVVSIMMFNGLCLQWILVLCLVMVYGIGTVWGSLEVNYPTCKTCSSEDPKLCHITTTYQCLPSTETYGDSWPGKPRNLTGRAIQVPNTNLWRAEFTWKPPYDASIHALKAFYLIVNYHDNEGIGAPMCFSLSLDQGWSQRPNAMNVLFKFDCIQSSKPARVNLHVTSLPRPHMGSKFVETSVRLPGSNRNVMKWTPHIRTQVKQDTEGASVEVYFYPAYPGAISHLVCLEHGYRCVNKTVLYAPTNVVRFINVPCKTNYSVWLRPMDKNRKYLTDNFIQSKQMVECPAEVTPVSSPVKQDTSLSNSKVAAMIVVPMVILIVAMTTITIFYRRKDLLECVQRVGNENANSTDLACNNAPDAKDQFVEKVIYPLYVSENDVFTKCVTSFLQYINNIEGVNVIMDPLTAEEVITKIEQWSTAQTDFELLVILSEELIDLLKTKTRQNQRDTRPNGNSRPSAQVNDRLYQLLQDVEDELSHPDKHLFIVSFLASTGVRCLDIFQNIGHIYTVVETGEDKQETNCRIKLNDMRQLAVSLRSVNANDVHNVYLRGDILSESEHAKNLLKDLRCLLKLTEIRPIQNGHQKQNGTHRPRLVVDAPMKDTQQYRVEFSPGRTTGKQKCNALASQLPSQSDIYLQNGGYVDPIRSNRLRGNPGVRINNIGHVNGFRKVPMYIDRYSSDSTQDTYLTSSVPGYHTDSGLPEVSENGLTDEVSENSPFLASCDFIPPESDDETDNVSLPQRIADINQRQVLKWQKL